MGTNYYLIKHPPPPCETCKRTYLRESLHIGKQSCGWVFSLHVYPDDWGWQTNSDKDNPLRLHPMSLADWEKLLLDDQYEVIDEYGDKLDGATVLGWLKAKPDPPQSHHMNNDPRADYGGDNYDLLTGNFS